MKKMKNIAVVLRGHVRTWHFNAPKVFEFYDSVAENVDYYFITWDSSNTDGIEETFKDKTLIHFQIMPHTLDNAIMSKGEFHGRWYNGHLGPAYMNSLILPHLRRQEKKINKKYDAIFDSRPDVLPIRQKILFGNQTGGYVPITAPQPNSIYITGLELQESMSTISPYRGQKDIAVQDWFFYMGSDEFETLNLRYHKDNFIHKLDQGPGTQIELREYIKDKNMFLCIQDWSRGYMMRPNVFRLDWLDSKDLTTILDTNREWPNLLKDEKIENCERYNIALSDYMDTASITCKI